MSRPCGSSLEDFFAKEFLHGLDLKSVVNLIVISLARMEFKWSPLKFFKFCWMFDPPWKELHNRTDTILPECENQEKLIFSAKFVVLFIDVFGQQAN